MRRCAVLATPRAANAAAAMRVVVQRVRSASVSVDGAEVSRIGRGLLVLIGLREGDAEADAEFMYVRPDTQHSTDAL